MCGTSPLSAQCSTAVVQLHSHFGSSVFQTVNSNVYGLLRKIPWVAAGGGGIETYTNGEWCDVFSVANCNRKDM